MNDYDIVRKNLDIILKNGDLFDVICLKEGVKPRSNSFFKLNTFFLSRILFLGVLVYEKLQSFFAPVEKIREAQVQIRQVLGVNVDIISFKKSIDVISLKKARDNLSILYTEDKVTFDDYISNLEKILNFAKLYNIDEILLRKSDITNTFLDIDFSEFKVCSLRSVLGGFLEEKLDCELMYLNCDKLLILINMLKKSRYDGQFIRDIGEKINDLVVNKALNEFYLNGDIQKLKNIVRNRLNLLINSDNTYKDKYNGKVFLNVTISSCYVKVLTYNQNGELIDNKVMSLYDFLEVLDFQDLLLEISKSNDNKEILLLAGLYLYLEKDKELWDKNKVETISFYDRIYGRFNAKKNKKLKKVKGIYRKAQKFYLNGRNMYVSFVLSALLLIGIYFTGWSVDFINTYFFRNEDSNFLENIIQTILEPYKYFWKFEKPFLEETSNIFNYVIDSLSGSTGDSDIENEDAILGIIQSNNDGELPTYYATGYASSATYSKGQINYNIVRPNIGIYDLHNVESLFNITYDVEKQDIDGYINNYQINLNPLIYPLGDNYVLTKFLIWDASDKSKYFVIDYERMVNTGNTITEDEKNFLKCFQNPKVTCYYGIIQDKQNSFVMDALKDGSYTSLDYREVREAIIKGLNLKSDASTEEILAAIKNKNYSTTPIKDAGLTNKIKRMNEKEYIETIASLDSLVCNLASTLAVQSNDELIYVVGFLNDGDQFLQKKESHAWAINDKGQIIEVTPNTILDEKMNKVINNILVLGLQSGLGIFTIMCFINFVIKKVFGHNIIFNIEVLKINKLLRDDNIYSSYSLLKEVLYGGINIPKKVTSLEFIDNIDREFSSFNREELKELKRLLEKKKLENKELYNNATKIVSEIPFIRSNAQELKRILEKNGSNKI